MALRRILRIDNPEEKKILKTRSRPQRIRKASGLLAWALQHEIDHLDGVLFTEHIRDLATLKFYGKPAAEPSSSG